MRSTLTLLFMMCVMTISACNHAKHALTPHEELDEYLLHGGPMPAMDKSERAANMYLAGIKNGVPVRIARVILSDYIKKTNEGENKYDVALASAKVFNLTDDKVVSLIIDYMTLSQCQSDDDRDTSPE